MKKRATPKKAASKKPAAKSAARSSSKPAAKAPAKSPARPAATSGSGGTSAARNVGNYQPKPIQSTGWAPFRYPPQ